MREGTLRYAVNTAQKPIKTAYFLRQAFLTFLERINPVYLEVFTTTNVRSSWGSAPPRNFSTEEIIALLQLCRPHAPPRLNELVDGFFTELISLFVHCFG